MDQTTSAKETVFVVKEDREHCFVFDRDDPLDFLHSLLRNAEKLDSSIEVFDPATDVSVGVIPLGNDPTPDRSRRFVIIPATHLFLRDDE